MSWREKKLKAKNYNYWKVYSGSDLSGRFEFSIKISKWKLGDAFGIADNKNPANNYLENNNIRYCQNGGLFEDNKHLKTVQFLNEGDVVHVYGNLNLGIVKFVVNNSFSYVHKFDKLTDKSIRWVPFIYLHNDSQMSFSHIFYNFDLLPAFFAEKIFDWDDDLLCEMYHILEENWKEELLEAIKQ